MNWLLLLISVNCLYLDVVNSLFLAVLLGILFIVCLFTFVHFIFVEQLILLLLLVRLELRSNAGAHSHDVAHLTQRLHVPLLPIILGARNNFLCYLEECSPVSASLRVFVERVLVFTLRDLLLNLVNLLIFLSLNIALPFFQV